MGLAFWGRLASFLPAVGLTVPVLAAVIAGTQDVAISTTSSSNPSVETGAPTNPAVRGVWVGQVLLLALRGVRRLTLELPVRLRAAGVLNTTRRTRASVLLGAHLQRHLHSDSSLDDASTVGHVRDLLQDLQLEFRPEAVNEEVGSEHIRGDVDHALNLVEVSDEAVHTLGCSLLCLAPLMVCAEGPKVFRLVLVVQESLEGSPGHVSLTGSLQSGPHFLGVAFHVVDCVHDPLLVFTISDWPEGKEVFTTPDECLEHFLVLASVLLRVVERVVRFLGDRVRDVGALRCGFGQHGVTQEGVVMDDTSCQELRCEVGIRKGKLALHYRDLSFHPPSIQLHFQGGVLVGHFLLGELLGRSM